MGTQIDELRLRELQTLRSNREIEDRMRSIQADMD